MSMTETHEWVVEIKNWLMARKPAITEIDMNTDLIETRILDSLAVLNFILFLEELTGQDVKAAIQSVNTLRTLQAIHDNILASARGASRG